MSYQIALARAIALSLSGEYAGCSVYIMPRFGRLNGEPVIVGYYLSDWAGGECACVRGGVEVD